MRLNQLFLYLFFLASLSFSACDCDDPGSNGTNNVLLDVGTDMTQPDMTDPDMECEPGQNCEVDPCDRANCRPDQQCSVIDEAPRCECPAGTTDDGTTCAADETCLPTTCNGQGACDLGPDGPECACDTGWTGEFCDQCDAANGYQPNGQECTNNPCDLLTCAGQQICVVRDSSAICECPAGTHLEGGICATDRTCTESTCAGHGTCLDEGGMTSCVCEEGWQLPNCQVCDQAAGYHSDGQGGCTTNPCMPNPCTMANQTTCNAQGTTYTCSCNTGFHLENGVCVVDEVCQTGTNDSCSGNGDCSDTGGVIVCTCDPGFTGDACDACDTANGYHDDGQGGCTQDGCLPNPCTTANKTTCESNGGATYTCQCDVGYHPDGAGGCTNDPCTPNICAATNQACRVTNNQAECYTPTCNDNNPCTTDTLVNGVCQYSNRANGSSCSTTECTDGQTCSAGVCGGGTPRVCNDSNACTSDSCDAVLGCQYVVNNQLIPDDGIACTVDSCSNGIANHQPLNSRCDDAQFCNGVETCAPTNPAANASGCVTSNVPVAPAAPGPCAYYGACNESTDSFPLLTRNVGSTCDDGVYCTSGDVCNAAGECVGTITPNCGAASCVTTSPFPGVIDIPQGKIVANFTVGGQPLPATSNDYYEFYFYAIAKDTGVRHNLAEFKYDYSGKQLMGPWVTDRLVPGIYDITIERYPGTRSSAVQLAPFGKRILMEDVVITTGTNTLNIDVPATAVTINYTIAGQPLPATSNDYYEFYFYAVSHDTGTRHALGEFKYDYSGKQLMGPWNTHRLIPGTYDIIISRYPGTRSSATQLAPFGDRILIKSLVIAGASQTINIDVPATQLTLNYTINGQPLPATSNDYYEFYFYAVAKDTGVRHGLGEFKYDYSGKQLMGPWNTHRLIPGRYDIIISRYPGTRSTATQLAPFGDRILIPDLLISGASQTINIDIPSTQLTINYTINGQPLPATSNDYYEFYFYAVAKDTGVRHGLGEFKYDYSGKQLMGPWNTHRLIPGRYDIIISRYPGTRSSAAQLAPFGDRVLIPDLMVTGPSQTINIDIPSTQLTVNYTVAGQPLPATSNDYYEFYFYAIAKDTGVRHGLGEFKYDYSGKQLMGPWNTHRLIPGTYDIMIDRYPGTRSTAVQLAPFGKRILIPDLVISGASQTLNINIPSALMNFNFTVAGQPLPATSNDYYEFYFHAVSRDTKTRHNLAEFKYDYSGKQLMGPWKTHRLMPGTYDILLARYPGTRSTAQQLAPFGERYLGVCLNIQ